MATLKIRRIYANKETFREVRLRDGLNIILAERSDRSSDRDSRNGVGKSSLVDIIHFCLGANMANKGVMKHLKGSDWLFGIECEIGDVTFQARRSFVAPSEIKVSSEFCGLDGVDLSEDTLFESGSDVTITVRKWKDYLGQLCFGIDDTIRQHKYAPSFRALVSYFARSGRDAYLEPFTTNRQQRTWQKQVFNAYLVGLNWQLATAWEKVRDEERVVDSSRRSTAQDDKTMAMLENERVRLATERQRLENQVADFRVVPEYQAVEVEADEMTREMRDLANESTILAQMVEKYEQQMQTESAGDLERVQQIYQEAGFLFPERVTRDLDGVIEFHAQITRHRHDYLSNEIARLRSQIEEIQFRLAQLDSERAQKLRILSEGGAVEELGALQVRLGRTIERLQAIDRQLSSLDTVTADEASIASERQALLSRAVIDRAERRPRWSSIIARFVEATEYLYSEPGSLNFGVNDNGYTFDTQMPRSGSDGVENMIVFSYDIALAQIWSQRPEGPGFLLHDSILYEGVDERQIALALHFAKARSELNGFQYIALMNSDNVPRQDLAELGLDWRRHIRLELGDSDPAATLLGYRF